MAAPDGSTLICWCANARARPVLSIRARLISSLPPGRPRNSMVMAFGASFPSAARGETPAAFGRRCIPADCVAPPLHMADMLGRRALSVGRLAALGATAAFHHGLLA